MNFATPILVVCCLTLSSNANPPKIPYFHDSNPEPITVILGGEANLTCGVRDLGDYQVVWARTRDLHILTAGRFIVTRDQRFRFPDPNDPTILQISPAQNRDNNEYFECKISTDPPISQKYHLWVDSPTTKITTPSTHNTTHVSIPRGSRLNLTCEIVALEMSLNSTAWIQNITDTGDGEIISRDNETSFSVLPSPIMSAEILQMILIVDNVTDSDAGEYSCRPEGLPWASINVVIGEAEKVNATDPVTSSNPSASNEAGTGGGVLDKTSQTLELILAQVRRIANWLTGRKE